GVDADAAVADLGADLLAREAGTMPDAALAARAGVTVEDVKRFRREHEIAPFRRPPPGAAKPAPETPIVAAVVVRRRGAGDGEPTTVRKETILVQPPE